MSKLYRYILHQQITLNFDSKRVVPKIPDLGVNALLISGQYFARFLEEERISTASYQRDLGVYKLMAILCGSRLLVSYSQVYKDYKR